MWLHGLVSRLPHIPFLLVASAIMNSNNYMANSPAGPQPNSWQPPDHSPRPERRALSLPGGLPPTITPPPPVAQFGATAASPAEKDKNPPQHDKKEEAAFPELGRAGSVLGWFVNWVSPPATAAENSPSAASAATAGNLTVGGID